MQKYQHVLSTGESEVCVVKPSFAGVDFDTKNIAPTVLNEKIYAMDIQVKSQLDLLPYVKPDNVFSKHYNYYSVHKDNPSTRVTVIFDGRQEEPKWVLFNDFAKSPEGKALGL